MRRTFQVGYYTEVAGLGTSPGDVTINGTIDVYNQCFASNNCIALDNFWRSLSNLTINVTGGTGCQAATDFWAVSQAAPMRRVQVNGKLSLMDYCNGSPDYARGGGVRPPPPAPQAARTPRWRPARCRRKSRSCRPTPRAPTACSCRPCSTTPPAPRGAAAPRRARPSPSGSSSSPARATQ